MMTSSDQRFPAKYRLKLKRDFDRVFQEGMVAADGSLVIHAVRNDLEYSRMGISIGRRFGPAHERNRFKRWCREVFRMARVDMPIGIDFVVRVKAQAKPNHKCISQSLPTLLRRLDKKLP